MNALILAASYPIAMRPINPVRRDPVGGGAMSLLDQWAKPKHEFTIKFPNNDRDQADALYAFYLRHRGSNPFWFDGAGRCEIVDPQLFFLGDGVTTQFILPFDNLFAPSWVLYENGAVRSDWSMDEVSGLVTFDAAPADQSQISGKGRRLAKCVFWSDGESPYSSEEFSTRLFNEGIVIREVP